LRNIVILFFVFLVSIASSAQKSDTLVVKKKHSPTTATLLSLALPGLGQCYNKKYWKVPIIYAGFAGLTYGVIFNQGEYSRFKKAYSYRVDADSATIDEFNGIISDVELLSNVDYYRRNRDLCYIGIGLLYIMNLIDATVDAHLYDFDVSDNLSLRVQPEFRSMGYNSQPYTGARLTFVLK